MPCEIEKDESGQVIKIKCSRGGHARCESCGRPATIQCDYPVTRDGKMGTCDRWQCRDCAIPVGPNLDYCKVHANMPRPRLAL
jgi:hypothetical protein